jgi:cytochrome c
MPFHAKFGLMPWAAAALLSIPIAFAPTALANSQLALDKGCYSCHGSPPQKGAPTMSKLAEDYAKYRGQAEAVTRLANKLREEHVFGSIKAHERLTEESALVLVRWLIDGAK